MIRYLILVDGEIRDATLMEWAQWFETDQRFVDRDSVRSERYGECVVSTIFLGFEHGSGLEPGGYWFETMIRRERGTDSWGMPAPDDALCAGFWGEMRRWKTLDEARAGHAELLARLRALVGDDARTGR